MTERIMMIILGISVVMNIISCVGIAKLLKCRKKLDECSQYFHEQMEEYKEDSSMLKEYFYRAHEEFMMHMRKYHR